MNSDKLLKITFTIVESILITWSSYVIIGIIFMNIEPNGENVVDNFLYYVVVGTFTVVPPFFLYTLILRYLKWKLKKSKF